MANAFATALKKMGTAAAVPKNATEQMARRTAANEAFQASGGVRTRPTTPESVTTRESAIEARTRGEYVAQKTLIPRSVIGDQRRPLGVDTDTVNLILEESGDTRIDPEKVRAANVTFHERKFQDIAPTIIPPENDPGTGVEVTAPSDPIANALPPEVAAIYSRVPPIVWIGGVVVGAFFIFRGRK